MNEGEDDVGYPPNSYTVGNQQGPGSSPHQKLPVGSNNFCRSVENNYHSDEEDDVGGDDEENGASGVNNIGKDSYCNSDGYGEEDEDEDDEQNDGGNNKTASDADLHRHPKKRRLKNLISSYEFAPRLPVPSSTTAAAVSVATVRASSGGRNTPADWTEHETFALLDAWGDCFLQLKRKSLRSEEWQEVAHKVSEGSKIERTDTQCRNRLDTLKKKYKKEKMRLASAGRGTSDWVYFKKMDMLMSSPPQQAGLSCGMDSREYVSLNQANGLDEMKASPGNSESSKGVEEDSDGPPSKRKTNGGKNRDGSSFKLLADSIQKFSEMYEKIERNKRQQIVKLEKMRMDFQRELEIQRRQILERALAEIAEITNVDDENDVSS